VGFNGIKIGKIRGFVGVAPPGAEDPGGEGVIFYATMKIIILSSRKTEIKIIIIL